MKLNKKNLFARYYNWIFNDYPNDICSFFWTMVTIIILFPFFVPGRLYGKEYHQWGNYIGKSIATWLGAFLCMLFGMLAIVATGVDSFIFEWISELPDVIEIVLLIIIGAITLSIGGGIFYGIYYFLNKRKEKKQFQKYKERQERYAAGNYDEPETFWDKTGNFISAIRGKYCTKITWK